MSFDKIFDFTAGVYLYFFIICILRALYVLPRCVLGSVLREDTKHVNYEEINTTRLRRGGSGCCTTGAALMRC